MFFLLQMHVAHKKLTTLGPNSSPMHRALWWSQGWESPHERGTPVPSTACGREWPGSLSIDTGVEGSKINHNSKDSKIDKDHARLFECNPWSLSGLLESVSERSRFFQRGASSARGQGVLMSHSSLQPRYPNPSAPPAYIRLSEPPECSRLFEITLELCKQGERAGWFQGPFQPPHPKPQTRTPRP